MATIPERMKTISRHIQQTFEELMKLLLRKTLRPAVNPLGANTKVVYNRCRRRYERGLIGSTPEDNINKYIYLITHESLGWTDDSLANFRVLPKFIKNSNVPQRFPAGYANLRNTLLSKSNVAFSDQEIRTNNLTGRMPALTQYKNFLSLLSSKSMQSVIANKNASFSYSADIPYTHSFRQLESVGRDIIDQTDPVIGGLESSKMSTSMLRAKLYILDKSLADLSVEHPDIFEAYIEMLRIINSVPRSRMIWVINLIALLSFQSWDNVSPQQQKTYIEALGEDFISAFNSNELITILLQGGSSETILTSSYLFSVIKMLFIVFGYSKLVPLITDSCPDSGRRAIRDKYKKHLDRYRGAFFRRGEEHDETNPDQNNPDELPAYDPRRDPNSIDNRAPDCDPVDPCIYDYIKLFGDLYPTLIGLMGGTEVFPPECIEVDCKNIPPDYNGLTSLPEYLWRFNDFSYCKHLDYVNARQIKNALASKVCAKAKYLQTI